MIIFAELIRLTMNRMIRFTILLGMLFLLAMPLSAQNLDSLYRCLDEAIAATPQYVAAKEQRIADLKRQVSQARDKETRYRLTRSLYQEYMPYVNDSAIVCLQTCIALSEQMGQRSQAAECRALLALQCSNTGMFDEAQAILQQVDPHDIDTLALGRYYEACRHVYGELAYYSRVPDQRDHYTERAEHYKALMYATLPADYDAVLCLREQDALNGGDLQTSMDINDHWMTIVEKGSHPYALTALYRYLEYKARGDSAQMMKWVVESALADVRHAVMNQGSMWEVCNQLMEQGDIDRASRYINFASDCAGRFGSRVRYWQIQPLLLSIDKAYRDENERAKNQLRLLLGAISVLALSLVGSLFYVNRQRKHLAAARDELHVKNGQLSTSNEQLTTLNTQLSTLNMQLSAKNQELSQLNQRIAEAGRVKEEYVGRFMRLCSIYIDKMDQFRKRVNKMVKNRDYEELYNQTRTQEFKDKELEELYESFDAAFLHLFPDFVEQFNALLVPEERIMLQKGERMNTSLRIFALIRLGIEDSSKIAEFLHYSVNTIYNYRARIKNGALQDREHFEEHVKRIGLPN